MQDLIKLIKIKVESMKKEIPINREALYPDDAWYNLALQDVLAFLEVLEVANKKK